MQLSYLLCYFFCLAVAPFSKNAYLCNVLEKKDMSKKLMNWMLMAALTVGLGFAVSSCKDDDDKKNEEQKSTDSQTGMSDLEEDHLRDLICQWCDVQKDELTGNWLEKTYEPTVGVVTDETNPRVRCIVVRSLEEADRYATACLGTLGIDATNPNHFDYRNDQWGSVSYEHTPNDKALAIIEVSLKQIPNLVQLYFATDAGTNAGGDPYYHCGDVVKYKGRYYVCASNHQKNEKARFVTLNGQADHTTGTFGWHGIGEDVVYNDDMASAEALKDWLDNIVSSKEKRENLRGFLIDHGLSEEEINQVVPANEEQTFFLLDAIKDPYHMVINTTKNASAAAFSAFTWETLKECQGDPYTPGFDDKAEANIQHLRIVPAGYLLANKVRWRINFTSSWDQWVPYVFLLRNSQFQEDKPQLDQQECITTLSKSHFVWKDLGIITLQEDVPVPAGVSLKADVRKGDYHVVLLAIYWQHDVVNIQSYPTRMLIDFTKDYINHSNNTSFLNPNRYWYRREITSREITFTDKGKEQTKYELVR